MTVDPVRGYGNVAIYNDEVTLVAMYLPTPTVSDLTSCYGPRCIINATLFLSP